MVGEEFLECRQNAVTFGENKNLVWTFQVAKVYLPRWLFLMKIYTERSC